MERDRYQINLLPYKKVLRLCKKYFKRKEKLKRGKPKVYEDYIYNIYRSNIKTYLKSNID